MPVAGYKVSMVAHDTAVVRDADQLKYVVFFQVGENSSRVNNQ